MGQGAYIKKVMRARNSLGRVLSVVSLMLARGKIDEVQATKTLTDEIRGIVRRQPFRFSYMGYVSLMEDVVKKNPNIKVKDGDKVLNVRLFYEPLIAYFESQVGNIEPGEAGK